MRFIGSKTRVAEFIFQALASLNLTFDDKVVLDGFAGTGNFSKALLAKYAPKRLYLVEKMTPMAKYEAYNLLGLTENERQEVLTALKAKTSHRYFQTYFSAASGRLYLTDENARLIDNGQFHLDEFNDRQQGYLTDLLSTAINSTGTHSGYLKQFSVSSQKSVLENPKWQPIQAYPKTEITFMNDDLFNFQTAVDIAYLDPPYNNRAYETNYHLLNRLFDKKIPPAHLKAGAFTQPTDTGFCKKSTHKKLLADLIKQLPAKVIALSYNNEGFIKYEEFCAMLKDYQWKFFEFQYRRYISNKITQATDLKEWLFVIYKN